MRVLLVDHDSEGLEAIARAIRGVLELDAVTSKGDALLLLRQNTYDVLIACERCVDGSGLDLLGRTTRASVPLKRIFAAAPERLQLLGPRLAPFKVQRTINYPIDLEELWLAIAQVTGGPNDETDGTIERVVLDERGIPSSGTTPRAPIPPRPPSPLSGLPPQPMPQPLPSTGTSGRYATARAAQPAPEPPLRAPPPPRAPPPRPAVAAPLRAPPPATTSDTGRMRAAAAPARAAAPPARTADTGRMRATAAAIPTTSDTGRMRAPAPPMKSIPPMPMSPPKSNGAATGGFADWTPVAPADEDLTSIAEQAKLGVQAQVVDEHSRLVKKRLLTAGGIAIAVAGLIVLAIELYDPAAKEREKAIAAEVSRMAEQQKVTDDLTLIEIDIENAIMNNDLDTARRELAKLVARSPGHARKDFLEKSIERADELARLAGRNQAAPVAPISPMATRNDPAPARAERVRSDRAAERPRAGGMTPVRSTSGANGRSDGSRPRDAGTPTQRTFGAPIGEPPRPTGIPLNAPINAPPSTGPVVGNNNFSGRTVEASDRAPAGAATSPTYSAPSPAESTAVQPADASGAGSAVVTPAAAAPAVDVTPAKLMKRVAPVAPLGVSRKTAGSVTVKFNIGTNGRVTDVDVVESSPRGVFDDAAQTAVRKWVYEPRKENGVAVESTARAKLVFEAE